MNVGSEQLFDSTFDVPPPALEPVQLEWIRDHKFVKQAKRGCEQCGQSKGHTAHHGFPKSFNVQAGRNPHEYRAEKRRWGDLFMELLEQAELPRPLARVTAEGECTFPDRIRRDQGNYRVMIEKALGDALQTGGWLADDSWDYYEFGGLTQKYEKGVHRLRIMIFPAA